MLNLKGLLKTQSLVFWYTMKNKYFPKLTLMSALFIASCAAWFSIFGISQLFIGASISTSLMALSLEVGKTISVSFVYRYWNKLNKFFKNAYVLASILLSLITSFGIYGYLMAAYTVSTVSINDVQAKITTTTTQIQSNTNRIDYNRNRIANLEKYRTQQENRLDTLIKLNRSVTQQQNVLKLNNTELLTLQDEVTKLSIKNDSLMTEKDKITSSMTSNSKIGTFWYVSQVIGIKLDTLVKWFILGIILVFDPLAIILLIAYNFMIKNDDEINKVNDDSIKDVPINLIDDDVTPLDVDSVPVKNESPDYPYYAASDYDWDHDDRWKTDALAIQHKRLL